MFIGGYQRGAVGGGRTESEDGSGRRLQGGSIRFCGASFGGDSVLGGGDGGGFGFVVSSSGLSFWRGRVSLQARLRPRLIPPVGQALACTKLRSISLKKKLLESGIV